MLLLVEASVVPYGHHVSVTGYYTLAYLDSGARMRCSSDVTRHAWKPLTCQLKFQSPDPFVSWAEHQLLTRRGAPWARNIRRLLVAGTRSCGTRAITQSHLGPFMDPGNQPSLRLDTTSKLCWKAGGYGPPYRVLA